MLMLILPFSLLHSIHPLLDRFQHDASEWSPSCFKRVSTLIKFNIFYRSFFIATWCKKKGKRENVQLVKNIKTQPNVPENIFIAISNQDVTSSLILFHLKSFSQMQIQYLKRLTNFRIAQLSFASHGLGFVV